jgi:phage gp36-like protein
MAYITRVDIDGKITEDELIRLTDESGTGLVDYTKVDDAIADAEAEIDSYCASLYAVPFQSPVPPMIVKVCKDITVYNIWSLKNVAPEDCEDRYAKAVAYLKDVAKGIVELGSGSAEEVDDDGPQSIKTTSDRIFTLNKMEGF